MKVHSRPWFLIVIIVLVIAAVFIAGMGKSDAAPVTEGHEHATPHEHDAHHPNREGTAACPTPKSIADALNQGFIRAQKRERAWLVHATWNGRTVVLHHPGVAPRAKRILERHGDVIYSALATRLSPLDPLVMVAVGHVMEAHFSFATPDRNGCWYPISAVMAAYMRDEDGVWSYVVTPANAGFPRHEPPASQ